MLVFGNRQVKTELFVCTKIEFKSKKDFTVISINKFMSFSMFQIEVLSKRPIHIPLHFNFNFRLIIIVLVGIRVSIFCKAKKVIPSLKVLHLSFITTTY